MVIRFVKSPAIFVSLHLAVYFVNTTSNEFAQIDKQNIQICRLLSSVLFLLSFFFSLFSR